MQNITSTQLREEKAFTWNVVFTLEGHDMKYSTDIIYAVKGNYWIANKFITHELFSLLAGKECSFCHKNKIACLTLCTKVEEIIESILNDTPFQQQISQQVDVISELNFPLEVKYENNQKVWDDIVYENTMHKILKKQ